MISDEVVAKMLAELDWNDQSGALPDEDEHRGTSRENNQDGEEEEEEEEEEDFDEICAEVKRLKELGLSGTKNNGLQEPRSATSSSGVFSVTSDELREWSESIKQVDSTQVEADIAAEREHAASLATTEVDRDRDDRISPGAAG